MNKVLQQGDIIRIGFDPSMGQEQQGVRPAFVVSVRQVNALSNRVIVAAISNGAAFNREHGLTVPLIGTGLQTSGVIICDQIRTMDVNARRAAFVESAPQYIVDEVLGKLALILGIDE
ncbi:type II toxin-antitoxin system PemK/MazF family toxin [Parasutterella muris]|uniref:type II toxin-antitoxin system PemK/MazF family toxin n=1 Tax=Parasutterella muris TaxID=2565572 RepID=UPI00204194AE|nr:type II toxin-antitoxin system PemK/MazF family toxin [Parasutterella muris]